MMGTGEVDQQGDQSSPEQALWRGQMVDNLNVYFYVSSISTHSQKIPWLLPRIEHQLMFSHAPDYVNNFAQLGNVKNKLKSEPL